MPRFTLRTTTLISERGEDPWVIFYEGFYYYCRDFEDRMIMVNRAKRLEDIGKEQHIIWEAPEGTSEAEVWAPELHRIHGKWYIYFTMGKGDDHRMYILEGLSDDPQGEYKFLGQLKEPSNQWAIDATVFEWKNKWYCAWSGYEEPDNRIQNIYIARMSSPTTIETDRVCISRPIYEWEKQGAGIWPHINEGPQALEHGGKLFIIYSASHSLTDDYCLGQLELAGEDPLLPTSWVKKPTPVFAKNGSIYGPGHASFIEKPDGTDWIVYHSTKTSAEGRTDLGDAWWDSRILRAQQFYWHKDGSPDFGKPRLYKETRIIENFRRLRTRLKARGRSKN
jgi:GH43 family beta-xylosidase